MKEFQTVLEAVVPVLLVIASGFFCRRTGLLSAEADKSLLRLTINFLYPCLILDSALGNSALADGSNLMLAPFVGAGTFLFGLAVATLARPLTGLQDLPARRTFSLSVGLFNYGFIPIPLASLLFGEATLGVLFVHNFGVEVAFWTIGVMVLAGRRVGRWRQILNPPLVAMGVALLLNGLGVAELPKAPSSTLHLLAQCAIPLSLILVGATVADHLEGFHAAIGWRVIWVSVALRIVLLPLAFLVLARYLPSSIELKRVIVLEAAMPSAVFPIVLAKHYGGDPATAVRVVMGTSVASLITIPLWIRFGLQWVGP